MKKGFLSGNVLKIIGLISMTIDHVGYILFPNLIWLRAIGRLAFPIYAFFIAEGCRYTKNKLKYFLIIFVLGLVCQIISFLFAGQITLNILLTFSFSIGLIYLVMWLKKSITQNNTKQTILAWILLIICIVGTFFLTCDAINFSILDVDYGFWGIMLPVVASLSDNKYIKLVLFAICLAILCCGYWAVQWFSFISIALLLCYDGTRGKHNIKYLFYIYYPVHIAIIYLIAIII